MLRFKSFLPVLALIIFAAVPNDVRADSVSVSASISANINVEINSESAAPNVEGYTGVIIDCRGLNLQRAMSPVIKDEDGRIIYGDKDLDFDKINEIGMAEYCNNINSAARAGLRPLIVQALGLTNFRTCPVLSNVDARKILATNENCGYLQELNVVFLTD